MTGPTLTADDVAVIEGMKAALRDARPTASAHWFILLATAAYSVVEDIQSEESK